jgi:exosortase/archaeosortase family protein
VPFGDFIVPVLQEYTAWFAVWLLQLSGLPMYREGLYISIPAGDFVVAEECSGVRYLIASVALGLIYAYISYRSVWRRAALVALAIALPIIANGIRAWGIIMIAHWTDMEHAVGVDHLIYGWVFFGFVMLLLFWLGSLWWEKGPTRQARRSGGGLTGLHPLASRAHCCWPWWPCWLRPAVGNCGWSSAPAVAVDGAAGTAGARLPAMAGAAGRGGPGGRATSMRIPNWRCVPQTGRSVELHLFRYLNRAGTRSSPGATACSTATPGAGPRSGPVRELSGGGRLRVHETVIARPAARAAWCGTGTRWATMPPPAAWR